MAARRHTVLIIVNARHELIEQNYSIYSDTCKNNL